MTDGNIGDIFEMRFNLALKIINFFVQTATGRRDTRKTHKEGNMPDDVSLQDYIDQKTSSIEKNISDLHSYIQQHFELNDKALRLATETLSSRLKGIDEDCDDLDGRVKSLETTKAFSAGKMWMVMAIFAVIPTILALIALFRG